MVTHAQLWISSVATIISILIPFFVGVFWIVRLLTKQNTEIEQLKLNYENIKQHVDMVPTLREKVLSLEESRRNSEHNMPQLLVTVGSIKSTLSELKSGFRDLSQDLKTKKDK